MYIPINLYSEFHVNICNTMYVYVCVCTCLCIYNHIYIYMHHICIVYIYNMCIYINTYLHTYMSLSLYLSIYIYIHVLLHKSILKITTRKKKKRNASSPWDPTDLWRVRPAAPWPCCSWGQPSWQWPVPNINGDHGALVTIAKLTYNCLTFGLWMFMVDMCRL